jgi:hypothetical protein
MSRQCYIFSSVSKITQRDKSSLREIHYRCGAFRKVCITLCPLSGVTNQIRCRRGYAEYRIISPITPISDTHLPALVRRRAAMATSN